MTTEKITLRPGDYVATDGMTEAQYHAVAEAFMAAGADEGEYDADDPEGREEWRFVGWGDGGDFVHWDMGGTFGDVSRQLTIRQVLAATNAGGERETDTADTITRLKAAHAARQAAEAEYQAALQALRDELGEGFKVEAVPAGPEPEEDMNDPANWREGDLVRCVEGYGNQFEAGRIYKLRADCSESWVSVEEDDEGDPNGHDASRFEFHRRPAR